MVLDITIRFLEPYRVQPWFKKEERNLSNSLYARTLSYARTHRAKDDTYSIYIPGTLLRSSFLEALTWLLSIKGEPFCTSIFKGAKEGKKSKTGLLRKKWIPKGSIENCTKENPCPLCLIAGRYGTTVDFKNLFLEPQVLFTEKEYNEVARKRVVNRVQQFTEKAHDYFVIREVVDPAYWCFKGKVEIKDEAKQLLPSIEELVKEALLLVDRISGALCVIDFEGKAPAVKPRTSALPRELQEKAKEAAEKLSQRLDVRRTRLLADCFRGIAETCRERFNLPRGLEETGGHHIWDKITINGKSLRRWLEEIHKNHKPHWKEFCLFFSQLLHEKYQKKRTKSEMEESFAVSQYEAEQKPAPSEPLKLELPKDFYEWIVVGTLTAQTPFHFGDDSEREGGILITPDHRFRIPHSALRGVLRRDLRWAGAVTCEVKVGRENLCTCEVCRIMRRIRIKDCISEKSFGLPEVRKRNRMNPYSGTVAEEALFDTEVGTEGAKFPFVLRYKSEEKNFPEHLATVLSWWSEGKAFLSGQAATGKGRFKLDIEGIYRWKVNKDNITTYAREKGFRGREAELHRLHSKYGIEKLSPEEIPKTSAEHPYQMVEFELAVPSPLLLGDPLRALTTADGEDKAPDTVFFRKETINGEKLCYKAESFRGILRTAAGRAKGILTIEHEDCTCELCQVFGSVHEKGAVIIEDLEVENGTEKVLHHVSIDRFLSGAKEKHKFDDKPLIPSSDSPIILKGRMWLKKEVFEKEPKLKDFLQTAFSHINLGLYPLGANKSTGYGEVAYIKITEGPDWLIPKKYEIPEGATKVEIENHLSSLKQNLKEPEKGKTYLPYAFLPIPDVPPQRTKEPPTHDRFHKDKLTGWMEVELELLTPLIMPDAEKAEADENGHKTYPFMKINGKPVIPGSELKGVFSSLYEALTNSCMRVFNEKKLITWRVSADEAKEADKRKRKPGYFPGMVIKKNGKLYIREMQELRLPVYDNKKAFLNSLNKRCKNKHTDYKHPTRPERIFISAAKEIRDFLKQLETKNPRAFRGETSLPWHKIPMSKREFDALALLTTQRVSQIAPKVRGRWVKEIPCTGYLKFSGPNVVEVKNEEAITQNFPEVPSDWRRAFHNFVECGKEIDVFSPHKNRTVKKKRHIPMHKCADREKLKIYHMRKRCERVFIPKKDALELEIPPEVIRKYETVLEIYKENWERYETPEVFRTRLPGDGKTLKGGELVYFRVVPKGKNEWEVTDIVPVRISRVADDMPMIYRIPEPHRPCVLSECPELGFSCERCVLEGFTEKRWFRVNPDGLCPACRLFGTQIYRSRVRFSFAEAENWEMLDQKITLDRLESPRPNWLIKREDKEGVFGRKFYLHSQRWEKAIKDSPTIPKTENNATFEVMKSGKFKFKVWFENLEPEELGALVLTISALGEAVKIGHAKPLGFGSVKGRIKKIILFDPEKDRLELVETAAPYIEKALKWLAQLWETEDKLNQALTRILSYLKFWEELQTEYPDFEGYKELKKNIEENVKKPVFILAPAKKEENYRCNQST